MFFSFQKCIYCEIQTAAIVRTDRPKKKKILELFGVFLNISDFEQLWNKLVFHFPLYLFPSLFWICHLKLQSCGQAGRRALPFKQVLCHDNRYFLFSVAISQISIPWNHPSLELISTGFMELAEGVHVGRRKSPPNYSLTDAVGLVVSPVCWGRSVAKVVCRCNVTCPSSPQASNKLLAENHFSFWTKQ